MLRNELPVPSSSVVQKVISYIKNLVMEHLPLTAGISVRHFLAIPLWPQHIDLAFGKTKPVDLNFRRFSATKAAEVNDSFYGVFEKKRKQPHFVH